MTRPSDDLEERLQQIRLVLMDIDGTLVTSSQATFDNVSGQLRRLKPHNVRFSVATGRTVAGARPVLLKLRESVNMRMPASINYNGAVLLSPQDQTLVERHLIPSNLVDVAIRACRTRKIWPILYTCRDTVSGPPLEIVYVDTAGPIVAEFNGMRTERIADVGQVKDDVIAILADAGDESASLTSASELATEFGNKLRATTSGSKYIEICAPDATKIDAMRRLATIHDISTTQIMAIGDNINDLEMIRVAGVGVAVGNAPDPVKEVATYVCSRNSAEGVVEALRMLVRVLGLHSGNRIRGKSGQRSIANIKFPVQPLT